MLTVSHDEFDQVGVCEGCRDGCHWGHHLLPFQLDHKPNWACCYCSKSVNCKLPNKRNPKGKK